jgi:predicted peroxiredoxin
MSEPTDSDPLSRSDFLKLAGAATLLPLLGSATPSAAGDRAPDRLYVVTHGGDDPDRVALAFLLAGLDAKRVGGDFASVTVWFTLKAGALCRKGEMEKLTSPVFRKFGNLAETLAVAVKGGAKLAACPFCLDYLEMKKDEYIDGLERKGGDYVAAQVGKAHVVWL